MKTRILTMFAILACVIPALLFGGILIDALVVFIMKYSLRVNITYSSLSSHGHTNEYIDLSS